LVQINPHPINPDMDIHPQGHICMQEDAEKPYTHIYDAQGKYQASIPNNRRNLLQKLTPPAAISGMPTALFHSTKLQTQTN
jgi:hypothetical protein